MTHKRDISSIFQCLQPKVSHSDPPLTIMYTLSPPVCFMLCPYMNKQDWMHKGSLSKKRRALIWKQLIILFVVKQSQNNWLLPH